MKSQDARESRVDRTRTEQAKAATVARRNDRALKAAARVSS